MIRYLLGILISLVVLTFVRAVWGIIQKAVVDEVKSAVSGEQPPQARPAESPAGTTLRKCAACSTYKPESAMLRHGSGANSSFFCSAECQKKANS
jgi:hypothetical protein